MGIHETYGAQQSKRASQFVVMVKDELLDLCVRVKHQLIAQTPLLNHPREMRVSGHNLAVDRAHSQAIETAIQLLEQEIHESERRLCTELDGKK